MTTTLNGFNLERLLERFHQKFGSSDHAVKQFFAPGRVNLVGDHTDYTGVCVSVWYRYR